jgi:hypothetical protein
MNTMKFIRKLMYRITRNARFITAETATAEECRAAIDYYTPLGWLDYDAPTPLQEFKLAAFRERLRQLENNDD